MKTYKYIILAITSLTILSCGDNDFSRDYVDEEEKTGLIGTLQINNIKAAPSTPIDFTFTLPQSFSSESTVQITGKRPINGAFAAYDETIATVTVAAGETSGSGSITMPGDIGTEIEFNGIANHVEFSLTGIALTQPEVGSIEDPFVLTSDAVPATALSFNSTYMSNPSLVPDALQILLDWDNPNLNDLDMYVYDVANDESFETAESGSRYEGDFFNVSHPDGDYYVTVGLYIVEGGNLPYSLHFTWPDGTVQYHEEVFENSETLSEVTVAFINKTTDANDVATYTISFP